MLYAVQELLLLLNYITEVTQSNLYILQNQNHVGAIYYN